MSWKERLGWGRKMAIMGAAALIVGVGSPMARAQEPIIGFWEITAKDANGTVIDHIFSGWTRDGLEFDQDVSPILIENDCYGAWTKLGSRTYGLTHPFFNFQDPNVNGEGGEGTEGQWDGTSGVISYLVNVSKDGNTFTGKWSLKVVNGPNPYDKNATVISNSTGMTVSAVRITVDPSQLPQ